MKPPLRQCLRDTVVGGTLASAVSGAALAWRGRVDGCGTLAPLNAPSHWFWGRDALRRNGASWRHTALGALVHHASSLFWAAVCALLLQRARPGAATPAAAAAATGVLAAVVDLRLVPPRLTPGFEHRLSRRSLVWVYSGFAIGLWLGAMITRRAG